MHRSAAPLISSLKSAFVARGASWDQSRRLLDRWASIVAWTSAITKRTCRPIRTHGSFLRGRTAAPTCAGCRAVSRRSRYHAAATARAACGQAHELARQVLQNATTTPRSSTVAGPWLNRSVWRLHGVVSILDCLQTMGESDRVEELRSSSQLTRVDRLAISDSDGMPYMSRSWRTSKRFAGTTRKPDSSGKSGCPSWFDRVAFTGR